MNLMNNHQLIGRIKRGSRTVYPCIIICILPFLKRVVGLSSICMGWWDDSSVWWYLNNKNRTNRIKIPKCPTLLLYQYFLIQPYICIHKQHIFISTEGVRPDKKWWYRPKQYIFQGVRSFFICRFRNDMPGLFQCIPEPGRRKTIIHNLRK